VRVFGLLDAPFESLEIGQPVRARLVADESGLSLLVFHPR
jgi:hypothetical protein